MIRYTGMEEMKPQVVDRYCNLIASIANNAVDKTEGVTREEGVVKYRFGLRKLKNTNCHVFIDNDGEVIIDLFINADYGYCIPEVVCNLQETIKSEVEEATKFQVKKINVNVANINI